MGKIDTDNETIKRAEAINTARDLIAWLARPGLDDPQGIESELEMQLSWYLAQVILVGPGDPVMVAEFACEDVVANA